MDALRDGGIHPIPWNCLMKRNSGTAVAQGPLVMSLRWSAVHAE